MKTNITHIYNWQRTHDENEVTYICTDCDASKDSDGGIIE